MRDNKMYQVSTLQALVLGYTRKVITVKELLKHGDIGLGTFEGVGGEMIVVDGKCYCATNDGSVTEAALDTGVPFAAVTHLIEGKVISLENVASIDKVKDSLNLAIEEDFGLNSMHVVRIDGNFKKVSARSEKEFKAHHVSLKKILDKSQKDFFFENVEGTLVCIYFPDYMDGINAAGDTDENCQTGGNTGPGQGGMGPGNNPGGMGPGGNFGPRYLQNSQCYTFHIYMPLYECFFFLFVCDCVFKIQKKKKD